MSPCSCSLLVFTLLLASAANACPKGSYPIGSGCWKCGSGCDWCRDAFHCYECRDGYKLVNEFSDWKECSWSFSYHFALVLPYTVVGILVVAALCLFRCAIRDKRRQQRNNDAFKDDSYSSMNDQMLKQSDAHAKNGPIHPQNVVIPVFPDFPSERATIVGGIEYPKAPMSNISNKPPVRENYRGVDYPTA